MTGEVDIRVERVGAIMLVTLNRPEQNNSMTAAMFAQMHAALVEAESDPSVRVVLTKAEGKSFCVGADGGDLQEGLAKPMAQVYRASFEGRQGLPGLGSEAAHLVDRLGFNRWAYAIAQIRVPMIAMVGGAAAGGGLGLALLHHFRFADTNAKFTTAFGRLGLGSELGCSFLLTELVGRQKALDMLVTSRRVMAQEALSIGLVDRLTDPAQLFAETMAYAETIAAMPPLAVRANIDAVLRSREDQLKLAMEREWERQKLLWGTDEPASRRISKVCSPLVGERPAVTRSAPARRGAVPEKISPLAE
jgi:enoyl-CoA hydratase/carnithine racemase